MKIHIGRMPGENGSGILYMRKFDQSSERATQVGLSVVIGVIVVAAELSQLWWRPTALLIYGTLIMMLALYNIGLRRLRNKYGYWLYAEFNFLSGFAWALGIVVGLLTVVGWACARDYGFWPDWKGWLVLGGFALLAVFLLHRVAQRFRHDYHSWQRYKIGRNDKRDFAAHVLRMWRR